LVKLHASDAPSSPLYINPEHVVAVRSNDFGTVITTDFGTIHVREKLDEVMDLLQPRQRATD